MTQEAARAELLAVVRALQMLPLHYTAWVRGVALRRHLSDVTGLSQARLANTEQKLRPKRLLAVQEHAQELYRANLAASGLTARDVDAAHDKLETLIRAGGGAWAMFWRAMDYPVEPELDACAPAAVEFDKLLATVCQAADSDDVEKTQAAFAGFAHHLALPTEVTSLEARPGLHARDWDTASGWREVTVLANVLLEAAYFDQFAHVDAVWGDAFFSRLRPRPVFELVAPSRRGAIKVDKPVRRLLQVCYALNHWARYRSWPAEPARAGELAEVFELRGEDVSNLFDGTTALNYFQLEKRWLRFAAYFRLEHPIPFPAPLVIVAICWQQQLVDVTAEHKLKSFIILDKGYRELWQWRRSQIAAQRSGTEPWAAWMDA